MGAASSTSRTLVFCNICAEDKPHNKFFNTNKCSHSYCSDCISKHISAKIGDNVHCVTCPDVDCRTELDPQDCRSLLPKSVFGRWMTLLCESSIIGLRTYYCPFKDCSELLVDDDDDVDDDGEDVMELECPTCHRSFCVRCKVPWHLDMSCEEFQRLHGEEGEDYEIERLAEEESWTRCPKCRFYVERIDGCCHIICRCGSEFCYACGGNWSDSHEECEDDDEDDNC